MNSASASPGTPAATPPLGPAIDREVRRSKRLLRLFLLLAALPILMAVGVLVTSKSDRVQLQDVAGQMSNYVQTVSQGSENVHRLSDQFEIQTASLTAMAKESVTQSNALAAEITQQQEAAQQTAGDVQELARAVRKLAAESVQPDRSNWVSAVEFQQWQQRFEAQSQRLAQLEQTAANLTTKLKETDDLARTVKELQQSLRRAAATEAYANDLELRVRRLERKAVMTH